MSISAGTCASRDARPPGRKQPGAHPVRPPKAGSSNSIGWKSSVCFWTGSGGRGCSSTIQAGTAVCFGADLHAFRTTAKDARGTAARAPGETGRHAGTSGSQESLGSPFEEHSGRTMSGIVAQSCHGQNRTKVVVTGARRNRNGPAEAASIRGICRSSCSEFVQISTDISLVRESLFPSFCLICCR